MRLFFALAAAGALLATGTAFAQQGDTEYLDVLHVKVRPDKMTEYEALIKKLVDANRRYKGDRWIAFSTEYGPDTGTLNFSSRRESYAAIENGFTMFEKALKEAMGPAGFAKTMADLNAFSTSVMAEVRRRAWDLSVNAPATAEERMKKVASARWIRSIRIELKPGRTGDFIEAWKPFQEELAKLGPEVSSWVSVSNTGPSTIVVASYLKSLAELDTGNKLVSKALATDAYRNFMRANADMVQTSAWEIHRLRPELSCPPDEFIAADPAFWKPKPMATAKAKPAAPAKPADNK